MCLSGPREAFDHQKDICRPTAGYRRDGVDQRFVVHPDHFPHGFQQPFAGAALAVRDTRIRTGRRDTATDSGRRIRHRADDGRTAAKTGFEIGYCPARRDRQDDGSVFRKRRIGRHDVVHALWFYGEDHDIGRKTGVDPGGVGHDRH